jgi:hypothetical protein
MSDAALISEFDEEMLGIYERALSEAHYKATRFLPCSMSTADWKQRAS